MRINYYCLSWSNSLSGGGIFDANLIKALRAEGAVDELAVPMYRKWTLPIWKKKLGVVPPPRAGSVNIVSHEFLHEVLDLIQVDCYIVHNYFSEFEFPRMRLLSYLYRLGSEKIFYKIFSASKRVVFLSARERRLAADRYPQFAEKFTCNPPGHNERSGYFDGTRDASIIEMPGTLDWIPKKISYRLNIGSGLSLDGTLVSGDRADAFISIIYDSFLSGFKLKLVEIAKHGKSVVSFCDLQEELAKIGCEDLPYISVGNRSELEGAIAYFRDKGDLSQESRRAFYRKGSAISWASLAKSVLAA